MLLDTMRRHSRSFIIYIFFAIIIAVFVVNFGPQSAGCVTTSTEAGTIAGSPLALSDVNYAMSVSGIKGRALDENQMAFYKSLVMDQFIVRELLVAEAVKLGIRVGNKAIERMLLKGQYLALGMPRMLVRGEKGEFDYDLYARYVRFNWGITAKKFKEQQRRELMAQRVKTTLASAVKVSESEVQADFIHRGTLAMLEYVRFNPSDFRAQVKLTKAKVSEYIAKNKKAITDYYKNNKTGYSKLPKQVRLSILRVNFAKIAEAPKAAPADAKDAKAPKAPDKAKIAERTKAAKKAKEAAKQKIATLHKKLKAGTPFEELAAESDDAATKNAGGLSPWLSENKLGLGEAAQAAVSKLKKGQLSEPIELKDHFLIVRLEGRRKGDLTLEQAQDEIARFMLQDAESKTLAEKTAQGFIDRARKGEKLAEMFKATDGKKARFKLSSTAMFNRSPRNLVPGIGVSKELMNSAFELKAGEVVKKPLHVSSMVYLVAVKERKTADLGEWTQRKNDIIDRYRSRKAQNVVQEFTRKLCDEAEKAGKLRVHASLLAAPVPPGSKEKRKVPNYKPCKTLSAASLLGGVGR